MKLTRKQLQDHAERILSIQKKERWHRSETLVYTLKHAGWLHGTELFSNDIEIRIQGGVAGEALALAETIQGYLNEVDPRREPHAEVVHASQD